MTDFTAILASLKRPSLLLRAARHGVAEYDRNRDLKRLLNGMLPNPEEAMEALIAREEALESARKERMAFYSPARHIEVMAAMLGEMRILRSGSAA
jgi:hypothetical protein